MVGQSELDTLIGCLRKELERIDQAIVALERMAVAQRMGSKRSGRRASRTQTYGGGPKSWASHHEDNR